jgi:hypothetical protein
MKLFYDREELLRRPFLTVHWVRPPPENASGPTGNLRGDRLPRAPPPRSRLALGARPARGLRPAAPPAPGRASPARPPEVSPAPRRPTPVAPANPTLPPAQNRPAATPRAPPLPSPAAAAVSAASTPWTRAFLGFTRRRRRRGTASAGPRHPGRLPGPPAAVGGGNVGPHPDRRAGVLQVARRPHLRRHPPVLRPRPRPRVPPGILDQRPSGAGPRGPAA